jgi:nitrogen-specific signal transduction histidine kinase
MFMKKINNEIANDFIEKLWEESWTYIKTVVDVMREPILILDKDFRVMAANEPFYQTFQVKAKDTENKIVYKLGNGQWNIPALRKLLETILPKHTFFKGFEVDHDFPGVGRKVIILNARQIHSKFNKVNSSPRNFPEIILLAMEDVTEVMAVAEKLSKHVTIFGAEMEDRTSKIELFIESLKKS